MPQIHIKLNDEIHDELKKKAKSFNYSLQEYVEKTLTIAAKVKEQTFFPYKSSIKESEKTKFTFIDLFAGIGGIRQAYEGVGGKCVFSSEWDRWCQKTYFENFEEFPDGDITKINPKEIPDHDILTGGFPCQPFSIAGVSKKNSLGREHGFKDKTQGTLFFNVARIIEEKRPKMFMLENVKNLLNHDKGKTFRVIRETLDELDYKVFFTIIDARRYVPQHRERLFIVGYDKREFGNEVEFDFPDPPDKEPKLSKILEAKVDKKYVLSDKLWNYLQAYAEKHKSQGNGFGYGLVDKNSTCRTLSARYYKDGSEILIKLNDSNPRRLTPRECANLMGFPPSFKIPVSDTQAYKQFGNSVVVPVVSAVAKEVVKTFSILNKKNS